MTFSVVPRLGARDHGRDFPALPGSRLATGPPGLDERVGRTFKP
jgi:hypothetical protein